MAEIDVNDIPFEEYMILTNNRMSEAEFQKRVVEYATRHFWLVWWTPISKRTNPGEPDLRMLRPPRYVLAELKSQTGRIRPEQAIALEYATQSNIENYLWRPSNWNEIIEILK